MNCNDVRENLIDVLADEQASPAVLAHLRDCKVCTQQLEGLRNTMALMDEWKAPEPSPYFLTRLQAHVREEQQKAPQKAAMFSWFRRPVLAGSLAAALLMGAGVYRLATIQPWTPPAPGPAVSDVETLDKDHDLLVNNNNDLINEMAGLPSDDAGDDEEI
ncbi:MAG TPA: hypothetical protein VHN74_11740 [Candidatus Angelobacter sp.]|jgi:hypothetical protein|nr:hypothetical protein [Candidatus Angelobacter sp.]